MTDDPIRPLEMSDAAAPDAVAPDGAAMAMPDAASPEDQAPARPQGAAPATPRAADDVELLGLIDRLAALLDRSDLTELEVEAGGTGLVLRKPAAIAPIATAPTAPAGSVAEAPPMATGEPPTAGRDPAAVAKPSVKAPLTGIFYASPAPGSAPYVSAGGEVAVGQIIGLIEAMKLFNEIKSDLAGRVVRVVPESGTLVKAKQPLIEVEPL
jgi:acetyl-CoA carboxylase biotin carboxyl carrier protein